ncbi:S49 family peptidase [Pseudoduganella sp. HUAS MS19]
MDKNDSHECELSCDALAMQLLVEMRVQRSAYREELLLAAKERRSVHRWNLALKALLIVGPFAGAAIYVSSATGFTLGPFSDVVGVIEIKGEIKDGTLASADRIVPAIEAAFKSSRVKQIVLKIDSPGGAPVEAERIISALVTYKQKYPKPVTAVIGNLGASAAYMAAMHADRIVAGRYSLVGSIGAILAPWQLDKAIGQIKVSQRVYTSGRLKAFLNPFTPLTEESDAKARELVSKVGGAFVQDLQRQRGSHLKSGVDYGTGEVWSGMEAKALGLVDEIGTMETVVGGTSNLREFNFGPREDAFSSLGSRAMTSIFSSLSDFQARSAVAADRKLTHFEG